MYIKDKVPQYWGARKNCWLIDPNINDIHRYDTILISLKNKFVETLYGNIVLFIKIGDIFGLVYKAEELPKVILDKYS